MTTVQRNVFLRTLKISLLPVIRFFIRDFLRPHFEEITTAREAFALPSGETILESLMEECVE